MLRTNLSTRPFYNERAVHLVLALVGLLVLALTIVNVFEIVNLSRQNTELSAQVASQRSEAERLTGEAVRIRRGINQDELKLVVNAAREANTLIDRRTFSWTSFFNYIEATLPPEVMLTAVRPVVDPRGTRVTMTVLSRRSQDVEEFLDKLEATGAFRHAGPRQQDFTEDGLTRVLVETEYIPGLPEPTRGGEANR